MPAHEESELTGILARLAPLGSRERAAGAKRYLKSDLEFLGLRVPDLRREVGAWLRERPDLDRRELVTLVEALWPRGVHELRGFAIELLARHVDLLQARDLRLLERLLRDSGTWAYVDALSIHLAGPLVERYPSLGRTLDRWARDEDFWVRRSAMLALLLPLRAGAGDWRRFADYADRMLEEREFFIRKAIGWVLREVAKKHPGRVARFVGDRIDRISGVTLREAVRYLEADDRDRLMAAYRAR